MLQPVPTAHVGVGRGQRVDLEVFARQVENDRLVAAAVEQMVFVNVSTLSASSDRSSPLFTASAMSLAPIANAPLLIDKRLFRDPCCEQNTL